jgi:hypothetical protein
MKKERAYYILLILAAAVLALDLAFCIYLGAAAARLQSGALSAQKNGFHIAVIVFNSLLFLYTAVFFVLRTIRARK